MEQAHVVIVGAGLSGLFAARSLHRAGCEVIVLEAQSRIGGRVQSINEPQVISTKTSQHLEMGAQWIHFQKGNIIYDFAKEHNLLQEENLDDSSDDSDDQYEFYQSNGHRVNPELCTRLLMHYDDAREQGDEKGSDWKEGDNLVSMKECYEAAQQRACVGLELDEILQADALYRWRLKFEHSDCGVPMEDINASVWNSYIDLDGEEETEVRSGMERIIDALMTEIPRSLIRLHTKVDKVIWDSTGSNNNQEHSVSISCADGKTYTADHVIVTSSIGYLKEHAAKLFEPSLPKQHLYIINDFNFGVVNKIFLVYEKELDVKGTIGLLWDEHEDFKLESYPEEDSWFKSLYTFHSVEDKPNVLQSWLSGDEAKLVEKMENEKIMKICSELLVRFTGESKFATPLSCITTQWFSNEMIRGSYGCPSVDSTTRQCEILGEPLPNKQIPRLQLSGEATSVEHYGTMLGAAKSGLRSAQAILDHLSKN